MSTLGKAIILFGAETATFRSDVGRAVAIFERGMGQIQDAARRLDGPLSKLAAGLSLAGGALFVKHVIDAADEMGKLAQKTGISTEELSGWKLAAELGDLEVTSFTKGLKEFNRSMVESSNTSSKAAKIFQALGVDTKSGVVPAFRQFADAIASLPDGDLKAEALRGILGKSGADWIPTLAAGAKGLDDARAKADALGLTISGDFAKSAERFNDNMKLIQRSTVGFANAMLSGGALDALGTMAGHIEKAAEKGEKWLGVLRELAKIGLASVASNTGAAALAAGPLNLLPGGRGMVQGLADRAAEAAFAPDRPAVRNEVVGKIRGLGPAAAAEAGPRVVDQEALRRALAENDAEVKRYVGALRTLENQLGALSDKTAEEQTLIEVFGRDMTMADGSVVHLEGSLEKLTAAHKVNLLNLALEITDRQQVRKMIELQLPALQAEALMMERLAEIRHDYHIETKRQVDQMDFETSLLGKSSVAIEKLVALRAIEIDLLEKKREVAKAAGDDEAAMSRENAVLEAQADRRRKEVIRAIDERRRVERDWATGAKRALEDYSDSAQNMAEMTRDAVTHAFAGMEDALVNFVKTGKLNFRDFANSVIDDLIRIAVRKQITGPLAEGIAGGSILPWLFGSSPSGSGVTNGMTGAGEVGINMAANGGIMTSRGMLPLTAYSRGGIARSPQLAMFGEGRSPEAFVPLPDGKRIPVALSGGRGDAGGGQYFIDARGADAAAVKRLEAMIVSINGSLEHRAVAAVASAGPRGGQFRQRMRS